MPAVLLESDNQAECGSLLKLGKLPEPGKPPIFIIRGVPDSGKTTFGNHLLKADVVDVVIEAEQFMMDRNGRYRFDASCLSECRESCQCAVRAAV